LEVGIARAEMPGGLNMRKAKVVWHKDDDAVSPVIGTILMVAITVVLAAVLWLMVSGMITDTDEQKTVVNVASPNVSSFQIDPDGNPGSGDEYSVYDAVLNINKITPKDDKVLWIDLKILIKGADGSVLTSESPLDLNDPVGDPYDRGTPTIEYWYVETTLNDNKMSAGDAIKITSMDDTYEGATVILKNSGEQLASITLPTDFS
jgi:flagellin-like protein